MRGWLSPPYFGRFDFHENGEDKTEKFYIGLSNLINDDFDFLIYDWRAPASGMFYDYETGGASYKCPEGIIDGELTLKRQYKMISSDSILKILVLCLCRRYNKSGYLILLLIKFNLGGIYVKRYEYRIEQIQIELKSILKSDKGAYNNEIVEKLNLLGEEGWELAAVDGTWFYFKRVYL